MTDAAKAARAAYKREWRRKNPDKVRAQNARYWERKAQSSCNNDISNQGKEVAENAVSESVS